MKTPTIEEVKEYFKNAKEVKCNEYIAEEKKEIYEIEINTIYELFPNQIVCKDIHRKVPYVSLFYKGEYAEIISYKEETEPTTKVRNSVLLQLAENNSFSEEIIRKECPKLFKIPTDIITIFEKYGKDKVIKLVEQYKK